jgi:hypothetical protein
VTAAVNWGKWEAIGTVGATVVALTLAVLPALARWWRRPRLKASVSDRDPHCVAVTNTRLVDEVVLRIEVRNEGRSVARSVFAEISDRWLQDIPIDPGDPPFLEGFVPHRDPRWRLRSSEPESLRWAGDEHVQIAPNASRLVMVAKLRANDLTAELCVVPSEAGTSRREIPRGAHRHRIRVRIYADGCKPIETVLHFEVSSKFFFSDVRFAEEPTSAEDGRLLTMLRKATEE